MSCTRERKTIQAMIRIYCRDHHQESQELCGTCRELLNYAVSRLDQCTFGSEKPVCSHCPIHCYRPQQREAIRSVMRYAGPRMILRHPLLAVFHLFQTRKAPEHGLSRHHPN
jgi:predicted amidophosphoribosyltransferase